VHYALNLGARPQGFEVCLDKQTTWVKTGGILTVNSTETYHAACLAGLGIIQVPRVGVRKRCAQESWWRSCRNIAQNLCRYHLFIPIVATLAPRASVYGMAGRSDERLR
jgi:DNA-binding transcriptional LysR family regulator